MIFAAAYAGTLLEKRISTAPRKFRERKFLPRIPQMSADAFAGTRAFAGKLLPGEDGGEFAPARVEDGGVVAFVDWRLMLKRVRVFASRLPSFSLDFGRV